MGETYTKIVYPHDESTYEWGSDNFYILEEELESFREAFPENDYLAEPVKVDTYIAKVSEVDSAGNISSISWHPDFVDVDGFVIKKKRQ